MDGSRAPHDTLAQWRDAGTDRVDPLRFHRIEALQRRASTLTGKARCAVDAKLAALIGDYAHVLARSGGAHAREPAPARGERGELGELGELADLLARRTPAAPPAGTAPQAPPTDAADAAAAPAVASDDAIGEDRAAPRDLTTVGDFRRIWSQVRVRSQLRESLKPAPAGAGPLNSTRLVHRALALMRDTSPAYLQHFMAYVDALAGLDHLAATDPTRSAPAPRGNAPRPRAAKRRRDRSA